MGQEDREEDKGRKGEEAWGGNKGRGLLVARDTQLTKRHWRLQHWNLGVFWVALLCETLGRSISTRLHFSTRCPWRVSGCLSLQAW